MAADGSFSVRIHGRCRRSALPRPSALSYIQTCTPESQVRNGLAAGGRWIRTLGPPALVELCCRALRPFGVGSSVSRAASAHDHAPKRLRPIAACNPGAVAGHISDGGMIVGASQRIRDATRSRLHRH